MAAGGGAFWLLPATAARLLVGASPKFLGGVADGDGLVALDLEGEIAGHVPGPVLQLLQRRGGEFVLHRFQAVRRDEETHFAHHQPVILQHAGQGQHRVEIPGAEGQHLLAPPFGGLALGGIGMVHRIAAGLGGDAGRVLDLGQRPHHAVIDVDLDLAGVGTPRHHAQGGDHAVARHHQSRLLHQQDVGRDGFLGRLVGCGGRDCGGSKADQQQGGKKEFQAFHHHTVLPRVQAKSACVLKMGTVRLCCHERFWPLMSAAMTSGVRRCKDLCGIVRGRHEDRRRAGAV